MDTKRIDQIISIVSEHTGANRLLISSGVRTKPLPYTRQLIIYAVRNDMTIRCHELNNVFGWKYGYSLVSRYYRKIMDLIKLDETVKKDVEIITERLKLSA